MAKSYHQDWKGRETNDDAESVGKALKDLGHTPKPYHLDLNIWEKLRKDKKEIDVAFNLCDDGFFSNPELEPHVLAMLEILGIPYTGSGFLSLAMCLDKARAKKMLSIHTIPTPQFQVFGNEAKLEKNLKFPLIVKPVHEDASIGIKDESIVKNADELMKRVKYVIKEYKQQALAEEFIDGREFNVGFIGDEVLPVSEIIFNLPKSKPKIVSYAAKWEKESVEFRGTNRSCPATIDDELKKKLISLARKASGCLLCTGYCRIDFRVDKQNNPFVLEVNPNPDISEDAGFAAMAKAAGMTYADMIDRILKNANTN